MKRTREEITANIEALEMALFMEEMKDRGWRLWKVRELEAQIAEAKAELASL